MDSTTSIRHITDPADPRLPGMVHLLQTTLADPNTVLGLDRFQAFLGEGASSGRRFHVIVAEAGISVIGAVAFSHVPAENCGFSEYIAVDRGFRGRGVARALHAARQSTLDEDARAMGQPACRGLFIEVEHPERTPTVIVEQERVTALDPWDRWRVFDHMGYLRVDTPYVQPPLAADKEAVYYMDLFFLPWDTCVRAASRVPASWILATTRPVWRAWTSETFEQHQTWFAQHMGSADVALRPLFAPPPPSNPQWGNALWLP